MEVMLSMSLLLLKVSSCTCSTNVIHLCPIPVQYMQHTNIVVNYRESVQKMEIFGDFCHRAKSKLKGLKILFVNQKVPDFW